MTKTPTINIIPDQPKSTPVDLMDQIAAQVQGKLLAKLANMAESPEALAEGVAAEFMNALKRDAKVVMLKMMGFEPGWHGWQIDHCNGRAGQSPIGDITKKIFEAQAVKFVETYQDAIFSVTEKEAEQLVASMKSVFQQILKARARALGEQTAEAYLKEKQQELIDTLGQFDLFGVAEKLLDANRKPKADQ